LCNKTVLLATTVSVLPHTELQACNGFQRQSFTCWNSAARNEQKGNREKGVTDSYWDLSPSRDRLKVRTYIDMQAADPAVLHLAEKMQKYVHTIHEAKSVACVPDTML
jgi:hypothetical protein